MSDTKQKTPPAGKSGAAASSPDLVEVRVTSARYRTEVDGKIVEYRRGDVVSIERAAYDATCEIRDGVKRPSSTFSLIADEKAAVAAKIDERKANDERFMKGRQAAIEAQEASERARARAVVDQANQAKAMADALAPLERPGAVVHG